MENDKLFSIQQLEDSENSILRRVAGRIHEETEGPLLASHSSHSSSSGRGHTSHVSGTAGPLEQKKSKNNKNK
jgi:hypothetical protein